MTRFLYLFWGGLDLLYLIRYCWLNLADERIPLYHDIQAFGQLHEPGGYAAVWFGLSLLLTVSIAVSAYLFLRGSRYARPLAYVQVPLRLLLAVPSLSFIPWLLHLGEGASLPLNLGLLLLSELLKVITLHRHGRAKGPAAPAA
ncbi:hypothetical protein LGN07_15375 [Burkholderia cepacia]|uniref:arginine:ornithine antiporter n=1 Tax=Burkholderia cepacia TaxID=292 RepID=UPI000A44931D|nr:arginine:ornithine antiporter [Burkholderia cepacia]MCA8120099.1 hypothetical protein [Burkholderia cepacia]